MLNRDYVILTDALRIAEKYYNQKTLDHAVRVMNYVYDNSAIPDRLRNNCACLAIMHDLLEDTEYDPSNLPKNFKKALVLITKPVDMSYEDYCRRIRNSTDKDYGLCAWFVKLADIKDHLSLTKTLTPKLKEKYLSGLRYLL